MIRHKYNAKRTEIDSLKFDSKLEASYYAHLKLLQQAGVILFFLRQVPFHLPGNVTYRADFMSFYSDGSVEIVDCKGFDTPGSRLKRKQVEDLYPVSIKIVTKV